MTHPVAAQEMKDYAALAVAKAAGRATVSLKETADLNEGGRLTGAGWLERPAGCKASLRALAPVLENSLVGLAPEKIPAAWLSLRAVGTAAVIVDMHLKEMQLQKRQQLAESNEIIKLMAEARSALIEYLEQLLKRRAEAAGTITNITP